MAEIDVAAYREQVFGINGQSPIQPQSPEAPKVETPATPTEEKVVETTTVQPTVETSKVIDDNSLIKEHLGFNSWDEAKTALSELTQLKEAAKTPAEIKYANDQSKLLYEAIVAGKEDVVYEILDTQKKIAAVDSMKPSDAIKLHISQTNKNYKPVDVDDVFEEKYSYPEKPTIGADEDESYFKVREQKWVAAKEKIDRRIERDSATAKKELMNLKAELKLPEIVSTNSNKEDENKKVQLEQQALEEMKKSDKEFYSRLSTKDVSMVFKFNDEANKLAFDIAYEPEKESFDKAVLQAADLTKFFESYYDKDGSPDRIKLLKDIHAGQNIEKIVLEAVVAATNQTKIWFLKNQKNIGDRIQRNFIIPPETDIDRLKKQVFN